jgi:hypothetical protein
MTFERCGPTSTRRGAFFLANRTEADFTAWRDHEAWTAAKFLTGVLQKYHLRLCTRPRA